MNGHAHHDGHFVNGQSLQWQAFYKCMQIVFKILNRFMSLPHRHIHKLSQSPRSGQCKNVFIAKNMSGDLAIKYHEMSFSDIFFLIRNSLKDATH